MIPTVFYRNGGREFEAALIDSDGRLSCAGWTTFDYDLAERYAKFAAERNTHTTANSVVWPERDDPMSR